MRILVVDDESVSRKTMRYILSEFGECILADNAENAISEFKKAWYEWRPFSLITLDIGLPDMSGVDLLSQIRNLEKEKNIPEHERVKIIMVTSHSDKGRVIDCIKAGCDEFIVKPADRENMAVKLSRIGI